MNDVEYHATLTELLQLITRTVAEDERLRHHADVEIRHARYRRLAAGIPGRSFSDTNVPRPVWEVEAMYDMRAEGAKLHTVGAAFGISPQRVTQLLAARERRLARAEATT